VESGNPIVQCNCFADQVYCQIVAPALQGDDAEKMQTIDVIWLNRKNFSITLPGLCKPA